MLADYSSSAIYAVASIGLVLENHRVELPAGNSDAYRRPVVAAAVVVVVADRTVARVLSKISDEMDRDRWVDDERSHCVDSSNDVKEGEDGW